MNRPFRFLALALVLCGSVAPNDTRAITPAGAAVSAIVVAGPPAKPAPPPSAGTVPPAPVLSSPSLPAVVPAGSIYVCVTESGGMRREVAIEFSPKVGTLCAKHPEMGPCQYERNACRQSGGRVYAAGGVEVTMQMEADYDRKVMRVRLK